MIEHRCAFIVGCPRSGTSWVRNMFAQHPAVWCGPESHLFPLFYGAVSAAAGGPVEWERVLDGYDGYGHLPVGPHRWIEREALVDLLTDASRHTGDPYDIADDTIAAVMAYYARRRRLPVTTLLVEKTPGHLAFADRILRRFLNAHIVEVVRDGRDVCVSMQQRARKVAWPPTDRAEQIGMWVSAIRQGEALRADPVSAGRWHCVRYEDLIRRRNDEVAAMLAALRLDASPAVVSAIIEATLISQVAQRGEGEHVRRGEVGDWRNHFDEEDVALFRRIAADELERAGYPW